MCLVTSAETITGTNAHPSNGSKIKPLKHKRREEDTQAWRSRASVCSRRTHAMMMMMPHASCSKEGSTSTARPAEAIRRRSRPTYSASCGRKRSTARGSLVSLLMQRKNTARYRLVRETGISWVVKPASDWYLLILFEREFEPTHRRAQLFGTFSL